MKLCIEEIEISAPGMGIIKCKIGILNYPTFLVKEFKTLSDNELLALVKRCNHNAYFELYNRYHECIFKFLRKYLKSSELSKDICQNVFLKIWEQREQVDIMEFGAYSFTMAKRMALDFLKRASVEEKAMGLLLNSYQPSLNIVENNQHFLDYMNFIENVLADMSEQTRTVFKLCRQQYKSYNETAEILEISTHTVKKHMGRSMKILKDAAEKELGISLLILIVFISNS